MGARKLTRVWIYLIVLLVLFAVALPAQAFAMDKRLKLAMKTGGYGAAAGFVLGAGSMALGMGGYRNMLMGASSGLYAGILLAAYIIATPDPEKEQYEHRPGSNPYKPRRPVGPEDYDDDDDGLDPHMPPGWRDSSEHAPLRTDPVVTGVSPAERLNQNLELPRKELAVWMPLVSMSW